MPYETDIFQYDASHTNRDLKERVDSPEIIARLMPMTWVVVGLGNPVALESREMCIHVARDFITSRRELGNDEHEFRMYALHEGVWYEVEETTGHLIEARQLRLVCDPA